MFTVKIIIFSLKSPKYYVKYTYKNAEETLKKHLYNNRGS